MQNHAISWKKLFIWKISNFKNTVCDELIGNIKIAWFILKNIWILALKCQYVGTCFLTGYCIVSSKTFKVCTSYRRDVSSGGKFLFTGCFSLILWICQNKQVLFLWKSEASSFCFHFKMHICPFKETLSFCQHLQNIWVRNIQWLFSLHPYKNCQELSQTDWQLFLKHHQKPVTLVYIFPFSLSITYALAQLWIQKGIYILMTQKKHFCK